MIMLTCSSEGFLIQFGILVKMIANESEENDFLINGHKIIWPFQNQTNQYKH